MVLSHAVSGQPLCSWKCQTTSISALKTAPSRNLVATAAVDGSLRVWTYSDAALQTKGLELVGELQFNGEIAGIEFSPTNPKLLAVADGTGQVSLVHIDESVSCEHLALLPAQANSTAWSPNGNMLAVGCDDFGVHLIDLASNKARVFEGHRHHADQLGYSRCGRYLASGSHDKTVRVWDVAQGHCINVLQHDLDTVKPDWANDGRLATVSYDQKLRIWNPLTAELLAEVHAHTYDIDDVAWSPDNKFIATCGWDNRIVIWCGETYRKIADIAGSTQQVFAMACSPNGSSIYAGTTAGRVFQIPWQRAHNGSARPILIPHAGVITSLDVSPDGTLLASTSSLSTFALTEPLEGGVSRAFRQTHNLEIDIARFSPCGRFLATGARDNSFSIYRVDGIAVKHLFTHMHERRVKAVAWSPHQSHVATGADGNIRVFDGSSGALLTEWRAHERMINSLCWMPDGEHIASACWDKTIRVFQRDGCLVRTLEGSRYNVNSIAVHRDGELLASACWDGSVSIWSITSGACLKRLAIPKDSPVHIVKWLPDSNLLAATTWDGDVVLLDINGSKVVASWNIN